MAEGWVQQSPVAIVDVWPDNYFAVIFATQLTMSDEKLYQIIVNRMVMLAQQQSGFLGGHSVLGEDCIDITVSYWRDREAIRKWWINLAHLAAQQMGRKEFIH